MIAEKTREYIMGNDIRKMEDNIKKSFRLFVRFWPVIILVLLISAYLEAFV